MTEHQSRCIDALEQFLVAMIKLASRPSILCEQSLSSGLITQSKCLTPIIIINSSLLQLLLISHS